MPSLESKVLDDTLWIKILLKRFDIKEVVNIKKELIALLKDSPKKVFIDFSEVDFIDSSALGVLVSIYKITKDHTAITFVHLKKYVREVFVLTRLDLIFHIVD